MTKNSKFQISNSRKNIFLVGMPAVGKTYWGEKIAARYKLPFVDLDIFIAEQEQASVSALFAMYGEKGFREREEKQLKKLIKTAVPGTIVACGGGTPCFGENMRLMKDAGIVVYLQADISLLLQHLATETEKRPLLNNRGDLGTYLADMLTKRKSFYEQAHFILHISEDNQINFESDLFSSLFSAL